MLDRSVLEAQGNHRVDAPRVPDWVAGWGLAVLLAALIAYAVTTGIWLLAYSRQVDLMIYRYAGQSVLHHTPLYDYGLSGKSGELLFTYPPFGAILFTPLALFPVTLLRVVVPIGNVVLLVLIVRRCWQVMGIRTGKELQPVTMLGAGALLWLTPVHTTIALGQIGLGLLAVLVFDLLPLDGPRRWSGVGVGLAAGIKLTPLLFIPFLLITGRARAAAVATVTFLATVAVGFLLVPSQAREYWLGGAFHDLARIDPVGTTGNESLLGMLSRSGLTEGGSSIAAWAAAAVLFSLASLVIAAWAYRQGYGLLAVSLCGLTSAAVSPFSWVHQWVWLVPLAVFLAYRAIVLRSRTGWVYLGALWIMTAAWITEWRSPASGLTPPEGLVTLPTNGWLEMVTRNSYLALFTAALLVSAAFLHRARAAVPVPRPD